MNKVTRISQHTGVSTFASRTSPSTDQSLQKSFHLSHPDKIELKKISFPSENKKYPTAQPDTTKTVKRIIDNGLQGRWTEGQLITAVTVAQLPFEKNQPNLIFHKSNSCYLPGAGKTSVICEPKMGCLKLKV